MLLEHVVIASSLSSKSKDEDDEFFEQEPPEDNRAFMKLIWEGIKKTYKMIKGENKKKDEPSITTHFEGGSSREKRGRHT